MKNRRWEAAIAAAAMMVGVWSAEGATGGSGVLTGLSGSGSYAVAGNVNPGGRMTLEAWVKPTGWRSYSGREKHGLNFLYKGLLGSHCDYVFALQEDGIPCLGNTRGYYGVLDRRVPLNRWTHLAVTLDNATGDMRFYINGEYVGAGSGWQGFSGSKKGFLEASGHDLTLGGFYQRGWGYNNDNFIGELADVRVWSTVRSAKEIAEWKDRQLTGKEAGLEGYWTFSDAKDRSGRGRTLTLKGGCKTAAGKGPTLWKATGVTAEFQSPSDGEVLETGKGVTMRAKGTAESGQISGVTFSVDGEAVKGTLDHNGREWSAHAVWTPKRAGWHEVSVAASNLALPAYGRSATVHLAGAGPYGGAAAKLPGRVEAENFDIGGEGKTWHDTTAGNADKAYRLQESVDISKGGTGYAVSSTKAGEWLEYSVDGGGGGAYALTVKCASRGTGGRYRLLLDGQDATGDLSVPDTGSWTNYTVKRAAIRVPKGAKTLRVEMRANGASGCVGNFDYFQAEAAKLELGGTERTLPAARQTFKEIKVTANTGWTAASDAEWLRLRTKSGEGDGAVTYDADANAGGLRRGVITVTGFGAERTYTVTQEAGGEPKLELNGTGRELGAAAQGGKEIAVKANTGWTAASDAGWITFRAWKGAGDGAVVYSVAKNAGADRTGVIRVSGVGMERTYTVRQQGTVEPKLELVGTGRLLGAAAQGGKEIAVKANVEWEVTSDAGWITLKTWAGKGDGAVVYGVQRNAGRGRTGVIRVSGEGVEREYAVTQLGEAGAYLELGGSARTLGAEAQASKQFPVKAGCAWITWSDAGWITLKTGSGQGDGVVYYNVAKNGGETRTGRIFVSGGGVTRDYAVTQTGAGDAALELSGASRTLGSGAQSFKEFRVKSAGAWSATSDSAWLRLRTKSGKGEGTVTYDVTANGGEARSGRILVSGGGQTASYAVTQEGTAGTGGTKAAKRKRRAWSEEEGWVRPTAVLASDHSDAGAVADGDEATWWSPEGIDRGAWVALTYGESFLMTELALVLGDERTPASVLVSEDAVDWREVEWPLADGAEDVQYLWVLFPPAEDVPVVKEIWTLE